jgi:hypothetical protein
MMSQTKLKLGQSVVVKPGIEDPDLKINISGWQGRITEVIEKDNLICVSWDSITLKQMPGETIDQSEEQGLGWTEMYLYPEDVELTNSRDNEQDVEEIIELLESKHGWSYLGEEGKRIQAVLDKAKDISEWSAFEAWEEHLGQALQFPFEAEISEWQERGPLRTGDKVKVYDIVHNDDLYGIIVALGHERGRYDFPLCDLEAIDKTSVNYQPLKDYVVWFANR